MDARVKRFRAEAVQQRLGGVGSRYPLDLRHLAVSVARERQGEPVSRVAAELGVSVVSLQRWIEQSEPAQFRPVEVRAELAGQSGDLTGPILITPHGYRIEGLGIESLAALLRVLG